MKLKNLKTIVKNLSLKKIINFIIAKHRYYFSTDEEFKKEQVKWRLKQIKKNSPVCFNTQECIICKCDVNYNGGLEYGDDSCEGNCFPEWMNRGEWFNFKINNNVRI